MKTFSPFFTLILCLAFIACNNDNKNKEEQEVESMIVGEEISYSADSVSMTGYIAYDSSWTEKRPGIIVVHEWWGHNDYVRHRADMLADSGYVALAIDMYGNGRQAEHPEDAGKFSSMVMSNMDAAKARFEAAMEELKGNPYVDTSEIAAIGYCFGGSVVLSMANAGFDLDAVAAFHSGVQLPVPPSTDIKAKVLIANGADDPFVSQQSIESYKAAMDSVGADYEYVSYENAVHAFTSPDADSLGKKFDLPLAYNETADKASWEKLMDLLDSVFPDQD